MYKQNLKNFLRNKNLFLNIIDELADIKTVSKSILSRRRFAFSFLCLVKLKRKVGFMESLDV